MDYVLDLLHSPSPGAEDALLLSIRVRDQSNLGPSDGPSQSWGCFPHPVVLRDQPYHHDSADWRAEQTEVLNGRGVVESLEEFYAGRLAQDKIGLNR